MTPVGIDENEATELIDTQLASFTTQKLGFVNAKDYGAVGDGRYINDCTCTGATSTVNATAGTFTAADVGKVSWGVINDGQVIFALGTVVSVAGNGASAVLSTSSSGTWAGIRVYIGTNDTAALQSAWSAAVSAGQSLFVPTGVYFVNSQIVGSNTVGENTIGFFGDGPTRTRFVLMPNTSTTGIEGNGVFMYVNNSGEIHIHDFCVDGGYIPMDMAGYVAVYVTGGPTATLRGDSVFANILVTDLKGYTASIQIGNMGNARVENVQSYNGGYQGIVFTSFSSSVRNVWSSNGSGFGVVVANNSHVTFFGGLIDEHGASSLHVYSNSTATLIGCVVYGGQNATCISLGDGSDVVLVESTVEPYLGHSTCDGIQAESGCTARVLHSIVRGGASAKCVTGAGTLIDCYGNTFTGTIDVSSRLGIDLGSNPRISSFASLRFTEPLLEVGSLAGGRYGMEAVASVASPSPSVGVYSDYAINLQADVVYYLSGTHYFVSQDGTQNLMRADTTGGVYFFPVASVTPTTNGEMVFELTSNTQLKVKVRGSDGTVRSATLTLS